MTDTAGPSDDGDAHDDGELRKSAGKYAWDYFQYHAIQRQSVFRFFLTLVGAATIAYAYSKRFPPPGSRVDDAFNEVTFAVGLVYIFASFLFWRLDQRSRRLIKLAEDVLKNLEAHLAAELHDPKIRLMQLGDEKAEQRFPLSEFETFRQVYATIFFIVSLIGTFMVHRYFGIASLIGMLAWYVRRLIRRHKEGRLRFRN